MTNIKHRIDSVVDAAQDEIVSFLQTLVQSPSLANNEGAVQELVSEKLKSLHLDVEKFPVHFDELKNHPAFCDDGFSPDSRVNIVGEWNLNGGGRSLILNGHVDVVPTGSEELWDESPWSGSVKNNRIYGRGSCDMKSGLAAGIFAIQILQNIGFKPNGNVMVQSVVGEESGGCGTLTNIIKGYTADAAVILEPTSLKVCPIQSGALTFRLTIPGRATHAAMRWDGVSAIEKFNLIHQSILKFEKERHQSFNIKYYESKDKVAPINIGTIKGGEWHSTVSESVIAEGRFGVFPGESAQEARETFENYIHQFSKTDEWLNENPPIVEWFEGQFESGQTDIKDPIIQVLSDSFLHSTGEPPTLEGVTYGSDLRLFTNHAHIPAVLFGPGDVRLAHAANEYVKIEEVLLTVKIIANLIVDWCGETIE
ncbi:MAG: ArgE/DapE family deacylase [Candidatus Marinimicrobia bacterium]|jgi:acetylornithine deacetylase|nr:ArgE/DapE family deacylase [Candidatus Neomarinimicrobiota bacterium]MBT3675512.1 ArgE/DapE family deacylase [Candidatus Neomarinimicrobiota bacterium]MBT3762619.1 ArgE/DapE family deacylase [Candidatus Neomarinimicrobiota bacterium]MBT4069305.1 ArgE/DapE family deacylase [Candidatus Neomarinimicrobiota bacterium]MBT4372844.1 ArgE/DapE family deacylase [Candidatus Neomarinimicrobiota bacterium]